EDEVLRVSAAGSFYACACVQQTGIGRTLPANVCETADKGFRPPLRGFGESLFFACAKKSNQKKAHPGREPAGGAGRCPALLGRVGAAHNSLRSDTWAAFLPPGLRCSVRFTGRRDQRRQQAKAKARQTPEQRTKPRQGHCTPLVSRQRGPWVPNSRRWAFPGSFQKLVAYGA